MSQYCKKRRQGAQWEEETRGKMGELKGKEVGGRTEMGGKMRGKAEGRGRGRERVAGKT